MSSEYSIEIAPQLRQHVTALDVIQSSGTLYFTGTGTDFNMHSGVLFDVRADAYSLGVWIRDGHLVVERNGAVAATALPNTSAKVKNYAMWDPVMISAFGGAPDETGAMTVRVFSDAPVIPPAALLRWAQGEALTPRTTYESVSDGVSAIVTAIRGLQDKIQSQGMQHAFWDIVRKSNRVVSKTPKRETDIHPTLGGLLADAALIRNIEIVRERPIGAGRLDFAFLAPLTAGGFARVCAEFKTAHSANLAHGLTSQLPAYMRSEGADFGIYGVLWFKGTDFNEPLRAEDPTALQIELDLSRQAAGIRDTRVLMIDLALPLPPSKRP